MKLVLNGKQKHSSNNNKVYTGGKTADETGAECKGKFSVSSIFINFTPFAMPFLLQLEYLHSIEIYFNFPKLNAPHWPILRHCN